jgi:hypothetical protein
MPTCWSLLPVWLWRFVAAYVGARLAQAPLELAREQEVGELGLAVGAPRLVAALLPIEVVEPDLAHAVRAGGDHDDAVADPRQQQVREREVAEVVGADLHLEAVGGARLRDRHHAGVVDQDVDVALEAVGERVHRAEVGEVEPPDLGRARDRLRRGRAARLVAHREHDMSAGMAQLARGGEPDAAVGAGDDDGPAALAGKVLGSPLGSCHGQQCIC